MSAFSKVLSLILLTLISALTIGQIVQPGFQETLLAEKLNPVDFTVDHHGRIWLIEKNGVVRIFDPNGNENNDPFITIEVDDFNERGLLGIALHPDFDYEPYVYLYYTVPEQNHNRVSRFRANGDLAVPNSEEILLELDSLVGTVHNGGAMVFDNSGYLFISTGDGAYPGKAQKLTSLLGKILRLDEHGTIPPDNPFYQETSGVFRSIYSLGHRNPFSLSYDIKNNILYSTDVGQDAFEEINLIKKGGNYGWPRIEGPRQNQNPPANYQDPLFYYNHDQGCAAVGLNIYDPLQSDFPDSLTGNIFVADYCKGHILIVDDELGTVLDTFAINIDRPLKIESDFYTGNFYYVARAGLGDGSQTDNSQSNEGTLWKVTYSGNGAPNVSRGPSDVLVSVGESALFTVRANGSPPLFYSWLINDTLFTTGNDSLYIHQCMLAQDQSSVQVIVSNMEGTDTSNAAILNVTANRRPEVQFLNPTSNSLFRAGDTIFFSGQIIDPEDGPVDISTYNWSVDLHHDDHTHPVINSLNGTSEGFFVIPIIGETDTNIWYRIYLSGNDSEHFSGSDFIEIFPDITSIRINGPHGTSVNIDGRIRTLPFDIASLIGLRRTVLIPDFQRTDRFLAYFDGWDDGVQDNPRNLITKVDSNYYNINFELIKSGNGSGLIGEYFNTMNRDFPGEPDLTRIDTTVNFQWSVDSPDSLAINADHYTIRWQGQIKPLLPGWVEFAVLSDDGVRLFIDDELVIDDWTNHGPMTSTASYFFQDSVLVPIRLEYFEGVGASTVNLQWSFAEFERTTIPKRQLYPINRAEIVGNIWHDLNRDGMFHETDSAIQLVPVLLFDQANQLVEQTTSDHSGRFSFNKVLSGNYYIVCLSNPGIEQLQPFLGINSQLASDVFTVSNNFDTTHLSIAFINPLVDDQPQVTIHPNPFSTFITVAFIGYSDMINYQLINTAGQIIQSGSIPAHSRLVLDQLPSGVYIIKYETAFGTGARRIIKQ